MKAFKQLWTILVSVALLLAVWEGIVCFAGISPALLPSPFEVMKAIAELSRNGILKQNILASLWRFAVGYTLAIVLLASIRSRICEEDIPKPLRGAPIVLISAALMSIAFMGFSGLSF